MNNTKKANALITLIALSFSFYAVMFEAVLFTEELTPSILIAGSLMAFQTLAELTNC